MIREIELGPFLETVPWCCVFFVPGCVSWASEVSIVITGNLPAVNWEVHSMKNLKELYLASVVSSPSPAGTSYPPQLLL